MNLGTKIRTEGTAPANPMQFTRTAGEHTGCALIVLWQGTPRDAAGCGRRERHGRGEATEINKFIRR